ncbi:hypothetical protein, partial [Mesorhizobium sp. Root552]|uniref:hypothetical protein n=1 Tax=Mesorhizobium sp. Root552 TaxID=1736555 RepID=UPI001AEC09CA
VAESSVVIYPSSQKRGGQFFLSSGGQFLISPDKIQTPEQIFLPGVNKRQPRILTNSTQDTPPPIPPAAGFRYLDRGTRLDAER